MSGYTSALAYSSSSSDGCGEVCIRDSSSVDSFGEQDIIVDYVESDRGVQKDMDVNTEWKKPTPKVEEKVRVTPFINM